MRKLQRARMQRLPPKRLQRRTQLVVSGWRQLGAAAIDGVAEQRRANVRHVHANLMRAARLELELAVRVRAKALQDAVTGERGASAFGHGHLRSLAAVPADRRVDGAAARQDALANRSVRALDLAPLQSRRQHGVALQRARDEQQAARVLVEPVHETGARQHLELGVAMQQRILQRARTVAGARVHDEADGLVDDEQGVIGMDDRKRYRLGARFDGRFELGRKRELFAAFELEPRLGFAAFDFERPGVDPGAQAAPRKLRQ